MAEPTAAPDFVRRLPWLGGILAAVWGLAWLALLARSESEAVAVAIGSGTLFYAGKEAGIPTGIAAGATPFLVGLFVLVADLAFVCFVYPPIHSDVKKWMQRPGLIGTYLRETRARAKSGESLIARFGAPGLFAFMLIPFALNGPLIGAVLGRIVGLSARQVVPTLFAAVGVTCVFWTIAYGLGFLWVARIDPRLPKLIALAVVALVVAFTLFSLWRVRRKVRADLPPDEGRSGASDAPPPGASGGASAAGGPPSP